MSDRDPLVRRVVRRCCSGDNRALLRSLALGQIISLLIAGTGISSSYLAEWGADVPTSQSSLNYFLLFVVYMAMVTWRRHRSLCELRLSWWQYALLALIDVEANFLIVKAYQYTTITSIMLIDCWTIPCVMFLSWWLLRARFKWQHVAGVILCLVGLAVLVISDLLPDTSQARRLGGVGGDDSVPRAIIGDMLCFVGATLYACSNIAQVRVLTALTAVTHIHSVPDN
jgi:solute carrier family 35, member F1/2